jgi:hypothetical protein
MSSIVVSCIPLTGLTTAKVSFGLIKFSMSDIDLDLLKSLDKRNILTPLSTNFKASLKPKLPTPTISIFNPPINLPFVPK